MSCDAVAAALLLVSPAPGLAARSAWSAPPPIRIVAPLGVNPLAREPLYARIIAEAKALRRRAASAAPGDLAPGIARLAELDMQGHLDLARRGTDGDLKCILKGISQDLPRKLAELTAAETPEARALARRELDALLRDNVEVITSPPKPPV